MDLATISILDFDKISNILSKEIYNLKAYKIIERIIHTIINSKQNYGKGSAFYSKTYVESDTLTYFFRPIRVRISDLYITVDSGILNSDIIISLKIYNKGEHKSGNIEFKIAQELYVIANKTPNFVKIYDILLNASILHNDSTIIFSYSGTQVCNFIENVTNSKLLLQIRDFAEIISLLLQIVISLYIAEKEIGFNHPNLMNSILVIPGDYWVSYNITKTKNVYINTKGNIAKIINYNTCSTNETNKKNQKYVNYIYILIDIFSKAIPLLQDFKIMLHDTYFKERFGPIYKQISLITFINDFGNFIIDNFDDFDYNTIITDNISPKIKIIAPKNNINVKNVLKLQEKEEIIRLLPLTDICCPYLFFAYSQENLNSLQPHEKKIVITSLNKHVKFYYDILVFGANKRDFIVAIHSLKILRYLLHILDLLQQSDSSSYKNLNNLINNNIEDFITKYSQMKSLVLALNK